MVGGRQTIYNNQPVTTLMDLASESIKSGEAVWFGCEVGKRFAGKLGIQDIDMYVVILFLSISITYGKLTKESYA